MAEKRNEEHDQHQRYEHKVSDLSVQNEIHDEDRLPETGKLEIAHVQDRPVEGALGDGSNFPIIGSYFAI